MSNIINKTPFATPEIYRGAPLPFIFRCKLNGVYQPQPQSLRMVAKPKGQAAITLAVGSGIVLSAYAGVADANATVLLTNAQSLLVPEGHHCPFEITSGPDGARVVVMTGVLVGSVEPK